jgi:MerR family copper efflux transcriptional regulator
VANLNGIIRTCNIRVWYMVDIYFSTYYICNMLINELSKKTGISTHTIRFYEKSGLIEGKQDESVKSNNYYHYDDVTVEKLEFISDAKSVGFTIKEIGQIIDAWYNRKYTKKQKLTILDEKLISLEQKMKEIKEMRKQILQFKDDVVNDRC